MGDRTQYIDPQEAMMLHCFMWYVLTFGDMIVPWGDNVKSIVPNNSLAITPIYDGVKITGFDVRLVAPVPELMTSKRACLGNSAPRGLPVKEFVMKVREYHVNINGRLVAEESTISEATKAVSAALTDTTIDLEERMTITIYMGPVKYKDMAEYRKRTSERKAK